MWDPDLGTGSPTNCTVCGVGLAGDLDDDPWHPTGPVCGDRVRACADDELVWAIHAADDDLGIW